MVLPEGYGEQAKALGRVTTVAVDGDVALGTDVVRFEIQSKDDEVRAATEFRDQTLILRLRDWTIIPLENLIAQRSGLLVEVAGAVHAYVLCPGEKTRSLSELSAGDPLLVVGHDGATQTAYLGRSKVERRPMLLVEAEAGGRTLSLVLQNAETSRLTRPDGGVVGKNMTVARQFFPRRRRGAGGCARAPREVSRAEGPPWPGRRDGHVDGCQGSLALYTP